LKGIIRITTGFNGNLKAAGSLMGINLAQLVTGGRDAGRRTLSELPKATRTPTGCPWNGAGSNQRLTGGMTLPWIFTGKFAA
jgi:hypothetical protein